MQWGRWVRVAVPATSANLGPGFDALGLALDWCEVVRLRLRPEGVRVEVQGAGQVPRDETNLVVRGARAALEAMGVTSVGLEVELTVELPVGRGLGSSAAAAVGGAMAANALCGSPLGSDEIIEVCARIEGHADNVAPAVLGGVCVCAPRTGSDRTWALRLDPPSHVVALLAIPNVSLPTSVARAALPSRVAFRDAVSNVQRGALLVAALSLNRLEVLADATLDCLHQPYRLPMVPGLGACIMRARQAGALGAFLSGAGSTVLALVRNERAAVDRVRAALADALLGVEGGGSVRLVDLRSSGAQVMDEPTDQEP